MTYMCVSQSYLSKHLQISESRCLRSLERFVICLYTQYTCFCHHVSKNCIIECEWVQVWYFHMLCHLCTWEKLSIGIHGKKISCEEVQYLPRPIKKRHQKYVARFGQRGVTAGAAWCSWCYRQIVGVYSCFWEEKHCKHRYLSGQNVLTFLLKSEWSSYILYIIYYI